MRIADDGRCKLFFSVYHAFIAALPSVRSGTGESISSVPTLSLDNSITELRDEIKKIGINFSREDALQELPGELFLDAQNALNQILFHFEDLVDASVLDLNHDELTEGFTDEDKKLRDQFPKLMGLRAVLETPLEHAGLISFGAGPREHLRTISTSQLFNSNMKRIYSRTGKMPPKRTVSSNVNGDENTAELSQILGLAEASKQLVDLLQQSICDSQRLHKGYLRIDDIGNKELEILLSLCSTVGWWQAVLHLASEGAHGTAITSICEELRQCLRLRKPTRISINGSSLCKASGTRDRLRAKPSPAEVTLQQILRQEEERRQTETMSHRTLKHNKKRGLAVKIAATFLQFFNSPVVQAQPWTAESIYITDDKSAKEADPQAYLSFCLNSSYPIDPESVSPREEDGDPSILALAALLLELEMERVISPGDEDIDELTGEPSLYMAVLRHHADLEDNVDVNFYSIIDDCLDLYASSGDVTEGEENCVRLQTELFAKVIVPLRERYETLLNAKRQAVRRAEESVQKGSKVEQTLRKEAYGTRLDAIPEIPQTGQAFQSTQSPLLQQGPFINRVGNALYTTLKSPVPEPQLLTGTVFNSSVWLEKVDWINRLMDKIRRQHPAKNKVRVALLDTGCDLDAECIVNLVDGESRLIGHWKDWAGNSSFPVDDDPKRHGTMTAALLLRVARHAEVFVARIAKDQVELRTSMKNIASAISHAVNTWDADFISMSFGFGRRDDTVGRAISEAIAQRRQTGRDIVFFAAANNDGLNSEEMFPASDSNVISVRGTDYSGEFLQKFNPNPWPNKRDMARYGTLAEDVPYDCANKLCTKSGCSLATPILAGLVATVVQYVEHMGADRLKQGVRTRDGILQVMDRMAQITALGQNFKYIAPWRFFEKTDEGRLALIVNALDDLQPDC